MHFGFTLELPDTDLWNIDLLDTHLDLLDTDIPSKYFVSLMSSRRLQHMSWRHVFEACLQDMSSRHLQGMSSRRLKEVFSVIIFRLPKRLQDLLQDVFKMSSKSLGKRKIVTLKTCWRHLQDQQMLAGNSIDEEILRKNRNTVNSRHEMNV